jgi:23S rRNA (guanine2445-N2)-methyltransferase / 23S rRNA (guanine2069-N7)-methyltransferase
MHSFIATVAKGLEPILMDELASLGAVSLSPRKSAVAFEGTLETAYLACLWSRVASRILLPLSSFPSSSPKELYEGVQAIKWNEHLSPTGSLAVDCHTSASAISHSHYAALKAKDAIVDQLRDRTGSRPSVDLKQPVHRINLYIHRNQAHISLDLSGDSLHRRRYRKTGLSAPMKENLAAAILFKAGWPDFAKTGRPFLDPMCGSGTLAIEAALMAGDVAPGLLRHDFGFQRWAQHDPTLWQRLFGEAQARRREGLKNLPPIFGYDIDKRAVEVTLNHAHRAGLNGKIQVERRALQDVKPPARRPGLLAVNPPYGKRLRTQTGLPALYEKLGFILKASFNQWRAALLTAQPELGYRLGLRSRKPFTFYNGPLECKLLVMTIEPSQYLGKREKAPSPAQLIIQKNPAKPGNNRGLGAVSLANRLRKNIKHLGRWARKNGILCYRLYDADLPEYALALDLYEGDKLWAHVQEYEAPSTVDPAKAKKRLREALAVTQDVLGIPQEQLFLKIRRKQRKQGQYEKVATRGRFHQVKEGNCRHLINLTDYLDTGLFLDHRITRHMIQIMAKGKRFLNLFAYTGTATVNAAKGGARSTTSIDLSSTYLQWAQRNLTLNGFQGTDHKFIQSDSMIWMRNEVRRSKGGYDLIFLDPPTFSRSKKMNGLFDVQRDYVTLISLGARLLNKGGTIIFSTNFRKFRMDEKAFPHLRVEDITRATIPRDFSRNPKIHSCWKLSLLPGAQKVQRPPVRSFSKKGEKDE